jgi:hypothetical protein
VGTCALWSTNWRQAMRNEKSNYTDDIAETAALEDELRWGEEVSGISHAELTTATYRNLRAIMRRRGLQLSNAHWSALFAMCQLFTETAQGVQRDRLVIGAPTGGCKTTLVVAFLAAIHQLGLDGVGAVVAQDRIAALIEIRKELRKLNVPMSRVTLLHSDRRKVGEEASDDHGPEDAHQIVLMTHQAIADQGRLRAFRYWRGKPRVLLYDEALWTNTPRSLKVEDVGAELARLDLRARVSADPGLLEAHSYVAPLYAEVDAAVMRGKASQRGEVLNLNG